MEPVKHIKIKKDMKINELVEGMKNCGFGARKLGKAVEVIEKMFSDSECKVLMGIAGAMVPGGMKKIIVDLIKTKKIDVLVTTGANLTHDLIEALGESHYHCDSWDDDKFHKKGYDRIYNVLMKNHVYEKLEDFFEENWEKLKNCSNIKEFLLKIGKILSKENIGENSILRTCYEKEVPIYCPAISDSGIGLIVWGRIAKGDKINVNAFSDLVEIIDYSWKNKKKGVIYIGGGVPKNYIQQSLQFSSGADYGVQITTDKVESGGSSGAPLEEGKSWGKLKENARFVDVNCDATIAMPIVFSKFLF